MLIIIILLNFATALIGMNGVECADYFYEIQPQPFDFYECEIKIFKSTMGEVVQEAATMTKSLRIKDAKLLENTIRPLVENDGDRVQIDIFGVSKKDRQFVRGQFSKSWADIKAELGQEDRGEEEPPILMVTIPGGAVKNCDDLVIRRSSDRFYVFSSPGLAIEEEGLHIEYQLIDGYGKVKMDKMMKRRSEKNVAATQKGWKAMWRAMKMGKKAEKWLPMDSARLSGKRLADILEDGADTDQIRIRIKSWGHQNGGHDDNDGGGGHLLEGYFAKSWQRIREELCGVRAPILHLLSNWHFAIQPNANDAPYNVKCDIRRKYKTGFHSAGKISLKAVTQFDAKKFAGNLIEGDLMNCNFSNGYIKDSHRTFTLDEIVKELAGTEPDKIPTLYNGNSIGASDFISAKTMYPNDGHLYRLSEVAKSEYRIECWRMPAGSREWVQAKTQRHFRDWNPFEAIMLLGEEDEPALINGEDVILVKITGQNSRGHHVQGKFKEKWADIQQRLQQEHNGEEEEEGERGQQQRRQMHDDGTTSSYAPIIPLKYSSATYNAFIYENQVNNWKYQIEPPPGGEGYSIVYTVYSNKNRRRIWREKYGNELANCHQFDTFSLVMHPTDNGEQVEVTVTGKSAQGMQMRGGFVKKWEQILADLIGPAASIQLRSEEDIEREEAERKRRKEEEEEERRRRGRMRSGGGGGYGWDSTSGLALAAVSSSFSSACGGGGGGC